MYQPSSSSYKYVSLDLTQLNQKRKSIRQVSQSREHAYDYGTEFSIQSTWSQGKNDGLRDSMLAYTKRMNDIRRIRGINVLKHSEQVGTTPSLWINAGKNSLHLNMVEEKKYYTAHNRMTKSLGAIKLEPLLGSRRISGEDEITPNISLQTHRMQQNNQLVEEPPVKVKHITVTITIPASEEPPEVPANPSPQPAVSEVPRHKLTPLGSGKARPRKAKRMKIIEPALESIDEDFNEMNAHSQDLEEGYSNLLNDLHSSQEHMLEQKRKTVALLKQTNYAQRSHQRNRQITMTNLAKKKMRRLPPIPSGRPSLKYTNGDSPSKSPYDGSNSPTLEKHG
ncbi:uncharacterized protein [Watersipora subatra]|uniref:uncharacterized protein n=1 Tax=Watersipora subatra TaxID=2589382 RepID=UPI00355BA1A8